MASNRKPSSRSSRSPRRGAPTTRRHGNAETPGQDPFGVEHVPAEVRAKALVFAIETYRRLRDRPLPPKKAYSKTWEELQRASYGVRSRFGYFIRYAHHIGEIAHEAQDIVEASRPKRRSRR